jgi:parallel beta-helix repeat protein
MKKWLISTTIFFMFTGSAMAYSIRDDVTGGDCSLIGTWDSVTKTCTLSADVTQGLSVASNAVILDGNGHTVAGGGITLDGRTGVTVKNFTIENGTIDIRTGGWNTIADNIINVLTDTGIMVYSSRNTISGNTINGSGYVGGIHYGMYFGSYYGYSYFGYNTVSGNKINNFYVGITIIESPGNIFTENTIDSGSMYGVNMYNSPSYTGGSNTFYRNNFLSSVSLHTPTTLWQPSPIGGNYWGMPQTWGWVCTDTNHNGFCDTYFNFFSSGLSDHLPWTVQDGWRDDDSDGYNKTRDCNDGDPSINITPMPGIPEIPYNGVDENCNGMADDDDLDYDGYGISTDCDDANATINPGAAETAYNGIDENCNGMTDDDDLDLDGYGIAADCNDGNTAIYPEATEINYDGIDQDCNGYDMTIYIVKANYVVAESALRVEVTSVYGQTADLSLVGIGAMTWKSSQLKWTFNGNSNPGTVTVLGPEGSVSAQVTPE